MSMTAEAAPATTTIRDDDSAILVSFELSQSNWVRMIRLPGEERMSRYSVKAGNTGRVTELFARYRAKAEPTAGKRVRIVTIYEAGLDGFWMHRWLCAQAIESHVVDVPRLPPLDASGGRDMPPGLSRGLSRGSDGIDSEPLLRTLAAWRRREPRVCSMVAPPTPEEEDRRRIGRERERLMEERTALTNRFNGLLVNRGSPTRRR